MAGAANLDGALTSRSLAPAAGSPPPSPDHTLPPPNHNPPPLDHPLATGSPLPPLDQHPPPPDHTPAAGSSPPLDLPPAAGSATPAAESPTAAESPPAAESSPRHLITPSPSDHPSRHWISTPRGRITPPPPDQQPPPPDLSPAGGSAPLAAESLPSRWITPPPQDQPPAAGSSPPLPNHHPPLSDLPSAAGSPPPLLKCPPAAGSPLPDAAAVVIPPNPTAPRVSDSPPQPYVLFYPVAGNQVHVYVNPHIRPVPYLLLEPGFFVEAFLDPAYQPVVVEEHVQAGEALVTGGVPGVLEVAVVGRAELGIGGVLDVAHGGAEGADGAESEAGVQDVAHGGAEAAGDGAVLEVAHGGAEAAGDVDLFDVFTATKEQIFDEVQKRRGSLWSHAEIRRFCDGFRAIGHCWRSIADDYVKTRSYEACSSFAGRQKKRPGGLEDLASRYPSQV